MTVAITKPDLVSEINKYLSQGMYAIIRNRDVKVMLLGGTESEESAIGVLTEYDNGDVKGDVSFKVNKTFTGLEGIKTNFPLLFSIQGQYWIVTSDKNEPLTHTASAVTSYAGLFTPTKFKREIIDIIEAPVRLKVEGPVTVIGPAETK